MPNVVELRGITKSFPGVLANDNINLELEQGEIHALLGENGSGKSTLMSILFGLYTPESGAIFIREKQTIIANPQIAYKLGIGMVHQHFQLIDRFTVTENIILGIEPKISFMRINIKEAAEKIRELSIQYNLEIDPYAKIQDLSVALQQRVEILKMLYRNAEIMIFDEPTAVLVPSEIQELMKILKNLIEKGKSILLITHKLNEIKQIANRCSVLSRGKYIGTVEVEHTTERTLAHMMIGRDVNFTINKNPSTPTKTVLKIKNLSCALRSGKKILDNINLEVKAGEVLGLAGVEGNGQLELIETIMGIRKLDTGSIYIEDTPIQEMSIRKRVEAGVGLIPEDRQKHGLVLDFSLAENIGLKNYYSEPYSHHGFLQFNLFNKKATQLVKEFDIRSGKGINTKVRSMSGGNQQKVIVAREINLSPKLLLVVQPTRGLDVGAIEYIHERIIQERDDGHAILLVSMELEEILSLSDRLSVMYNGHIINTFESTSIDQTTLGLMMIGKKQ